MADVKNIITLGIGASPGSLLWFFTSGLESSDLGPIVMPNNAAFVEFRDKRAVVPFRDKRAAVPFRDKRAVVVAK